MSETAGYTENFEEWDRAMQANDIAAEGTHRQPVRSARHLAKSKGSYALLPSIIVDDAVYVMHTKRFATEEQVMGYLEEAFVVMTIYLTDEDARPLYWVRGAKRPFTHWIEPDPRAR